MFPNIPATILHRVPQCILVHQKTSGQISCFQGFCRGLVTELSFAVARACLNWRPHGQGFPFESFGCSTTNSPMTCSTSLRSTKLAKPTISRTKRPKVAATHPLPQPLCKSETWYTCTRCTWNTAGMSPMVVPVKLLSTPTASGVLIPLLVLRFWNPVYVLQCEARWVLQCTPWPTIPPLVYPSAVPTLDKDEWCEENLAQPPPCLLPSTPPDPLQPRSLHESLIP